MHSVGLQERGRAEIRVNSIIPWIGYYRANSARPDRSSARAHAGGQMQRLR